MKIWCVQLKRRSERTDDSPLRHFPCISSNFMVTSSQNCVWWTWVIQGVVMIHDNTRPHTAAATQNLITTFGWEQFDHPPYNPDLAPSDFHLFLHLKSFLAGRQLHDDEVKETVTTGFTSQAASFYDEGIQNWCNVMTSASTMVVTMSKSSVWCVHQMAIYEGCSKSIGP